MELLNFINDWLLKPSLLIAIFLIINRFAVKASAASRHYFLASAGVCLLCLPFTSLLLPSWSLAIFSSSWPQWLIDFQVPVALKQCLLLGYLLGVNWILIYLLLGIVALKRLTSRAQQSDQQGDEKLLQELSTALAITRPVRLVVSGEITSPQVWGLFRPVVMLPLSSAEWTWQRKRFVFIHELAHVARWDWLLTILMKISCALFWFLPLSWMLARRMAANAEMACDDFVYRLHFKADIGEGVDYADNLLQLALRERNRDMDAALQINNGSPVYQRVSSVLDIKRERECLNSDQKGLALLLGLLLLLTLAGLQLSVQTNLLATGLNIYSVLDAPAPRSDQQPALRVTLPTLAALRAGRVESLEQPDTTELVVFAEPNSAPEPSLPITAAQPKLELRQPQVSMQGYLSQRTVVPRYPRRALYLGLEGDVTVSFSIDEQGHAVDVAIVAAEPKGVFEREVLAAIAQFQYRPQQLNGLAVVVTDVEETFNFRLRDEYPAAAESLDPSAGSTPLAHSQTFESSLQPRRR